jgi:hypothetical protein
MHVWPRKSSEVMASLLLLICPLPRPSPKVGTTAGTVPEEIGRGPGAGERSISNNQLRLRPAGMQKAIIFQKQQLHTVYTTC